MWAEEERIRFYFAATHRRATTLLHATVQKIGSDPSLSEVIQLLDARHRLHEAYIDMENEINDFINFDTNFIKCPRFYTELTSLARTTGDFMVKALSMSTESLSNVSDVDDIFQCSLMTCLEISSQIANLTSKGRDLSRHEARDLPHIKNLLTRTLTHIEDHWDNLLQEAQSRGDTAVFSELDSLVKMAQFPTEKLRPCWDKNLMNQDPSDNPDAITPGKSGDDVNDTPETNGGKNAVSKAQEGVTMMDPGKRDIATLRRPTNRNPFHNGSTLNHPKLDKDEHVGLQLITKTFESIRSNIATAWNKAMVWIDDEVVFARLNTLLTVAREATDRVIEAAERAKTNAANRLSAVQAEPDDLPPYIGEGQTETHQESIKRSDMHRTYQNCPKPLPTGNGGLVTTRRIHVRGEDPQPIVKEAVPQPTKPGTSIYIKKIEIRSPIELHPECQVMTNSTEIEKPVPLPTMPPLEDAETKFKYQETGAIEILLPIEIRAKLIQTFPRLDQNTTELPHVVKLAANDNDWPKTDRDAEQPERVKPRDSDSLQQTADMGSHGETIKPDKKMCNTLSRLRTRSRLHEIANKRRQASNNNNREQPLLDQDIVIHNQGTWTNTILRTPPPESTAKTATTAIMTTKGASSTWKKTPSSQPDHGY